MIEPQILSRLDATTAEALGELYTGLGQSLLVQARHLAAASAHRERLRKRRREARDIARAVEREVARGRTARQAVASVQALFADWKPAEIAAIWLQFRPSKALQRERRNLEIVRWARKGLTNAEVARKVGLHKDTVSRVISRLLGGYRRRFARHSAKEILPCPLSHRR